MHDDDEVYGCGVLPWETDYNGTPGWRDAIADLCDNYKVPTRIPWDVDAAMSPDEDGIYRTMKTYQCEGKTAWYNPDI